MHKDKKFNLLITEQTLYILNEKQPDYGIKTYYLIIKVDA
jgi:hypothetical protein